MNDKAPKAKSYHFNAHQGGTSTKEASLTLSCLPHTNGGIQAINAGSPNVHLNVHTVQKVDREKRKNDW